MMHDLTQIRQEQDNLKTEKRLLDQKFQEQMEKLKNVEERMQQALTDCEHYHSELETIRKYSSKFSQSDQEIIEKICQIILESSDLEANVSLMEG